MHIQFKSRLLVMLILAVSLMGCSKRPIIRYNPNDFITPNRVVEKRVPEPVVTPRINATFGVGNNPAVIKAYKLFTKKGIAKNISSQGFKTFGYDAYAHPIVACAPLHLCIVQLEQGETINNIDLGDNAHWLTATAMIGSAQEGSYQVVLKPKLYGISTDMVITTNKRTYNIGLVSERGATTHVVNFYYPEETLQRTIERVHHQESLSDQKGMVSQSTGININQVNFNYSMTGDYPAWRPVRVFDDGSKTFIQMPPVSERMDLPVLYLVKNDAMQLVNYRYRRPYYIVDGLFQVAYLVSGKGSDQIKVAITNHNFR
jgi:type IV secretion system protein TrbG